MTLIQFLGDVGSGKTVGSTYFAKNDTRKVYANYNIKIPNFHPLKPETLVDLNEPSLVIIDEGYTWLESRTSGRYLNRFMSYILFQSRKREIDIILTDQLLGTIDVRFRQMTNFEIHCRQIMDVGFEYRIFKLSGFKRYNPVSLILPYDYAEKNIFPLYDSWELVNPIDDSLIFNITEDKTAILKDIDKIVSYLLSKASVREYRKGDVADYCLRHGYPKEYVPMVYDALKAQRFEHDNSEPEPETLPKTKPKKYRLRP